MATPGRATSLGAIARLGRWRCVHIQSRFTAPLALWHDQLPTLICNELDPGADFLPITMSYMDRIKTAARKAGSQASMYAQKGYTQLESHARNVQAGFSLPAECQRAAKILEGFLADPNNPETALNSIPKAVLLQAKGLAIFTVVKAGFVWSGKAGSGVVIARLPDGSWSAPSCIVTAGVGFGFQIGADLVEYVIVMNSEEAVRSFGLAGNLTFGGNLSAAAGPIGSGGAISSALVHAAPMFTYSRSKGLYGGASLEGTALLERKDANAQFYGQSIPAMDLLLGKVPAPEVASVMYEVVEAAEQVDETGLPEQAYVPQEHFGQATTLNQSGEATGTQSVAASAGEPTSSQPTASKPFQTNEPGVDASAPSTPSVPGKAADAAASATKP